MAVSLKFEKVVPSGQGLGYYDGRAVFCLGVLPGEVCEVEIVRSTPTFAIAKLLEVTKPSPKRGNHDLMPAYAVWENVDYGYQLEMKRAMLEELFEKQHLVPAVDAMVASPVETAYRNKLTFILRLQDDQLKLAMHSASSDEAYNTPEGCSLGQSVLNRVALAVVDRLNRSEVKSNSIELTVRISTSGQVIASLMLSKHRRADYQSLRVAGLDGLIVRTDERVVWHSGQTELTDRIGGVDVTYPALEFMQVNVATFELALASIMLQISESNKVMDLYGGAGSIGLSVSRVADVLGVEQNPRSVELARASAISQGLDRYRATVATADSLPDSMFDGIDTVIVDPPRAGLVKQLVDQFLRLKPERIIYLSCDPATQARDTARLSAEYECSNVTGFDFFPGTPHCESLITYRRRG